MPIIDTQRRARELGRIRLGQTVEGKNRKGETVTRPEKLDRFRFTSASKPLLDAVAELYGGTVAQWTPLNGGAAQWEVVTDATRLPVMIPPQPLTQWYELWSGGGCQRRCDGQTEVLTDTPCLCTQADERLCKPTTRLNVVVSDVPGLGVWRVESHGWYAAMELPQAAEFLAQTRGYVAAHLALEERSAKRTNERTGKVETRRWMVPTLEVDITPRQLLAGEGGITPGAPAVKGSAAAQVGVSEAPRQIEAPQASTEPVDWHARAVEVATVEGLRAVWTDANAAGALDADPRLRAFLEQRAKELSGEAEGEATDPDESGPEAEDTTEQPSPSGAAPEGDGERQSLWMQVMAAAGVDGKSTEEVREEFAKFADGETFDTADIGLCREYTREVAAAASGGAA